MSIFNRLGRLVRSELNHLADRVSQRRASGPAPEAEEVEAGPRPAREAPRSGAGSSTSPYPKDVRDAYAALELPLGADREAVRKAYRALLRRYHPDRHQNDPGRAATATELTRRLTEAQKTLLAFLEAKGG